MAACALFREWEDPDPAELLRIELPVEAAYRPGRFFERELRPLLAVLEAAGRDFEALVIDGYVHLEEEAGKGLGTHLHEALPYRPVVIGVAKNTLGVAADFVPVLRGRSRRPLYVSAIGCDLDEAARRVAEMHGPHRIPTLLRVVDEHARSG
ncbi:MAG: endonuclease V [bacterium]